MPANAETFLHSALATGFRHWAIGGQPEIQSWIIQFRPIERGFPAFVSKQSAK
jgi:hypothetical protein